MSKYIILMSDNRSLDENLETSDYNSLTCFLNYEYSRKHDYDFIYLNPNLDGSKKLHNCLSPSGNPRHASWSKIISILKIMENYSFYEKIIYIDSDCIFFNFNLSIENYLENSKTINNQKIKNENKIVFLNDLPWNNSLPCAGFFISPNNDQIKNFFKKWYLNEKFIEKNTQHPWEQTSLHKCLLVEDAENIEIINDWMFRAKENQFLRHIGSDDGSNRVPYFKNIIEKNYNKEYYTSIMSQVLYNNMLTYDTKNINLY